MPGTPVTQCPAVRTTLGAMTDPEHSAISCPPAYMSIVAASGYAVAGDPLMMAERVAPNPAPGGPDGAPEHAPTTTAAMAKAAPRPLEPRRFTMVVRMSPPATNVCALL